MLGVGLNEWERPIWMLPSIDMFWMFWAIKYGLPAAFLWQFAVISILIATILKKGLSEKERQYRFAFAVAIIGLYIVGWTVHFWGAVFVLFVFLLGSGAWILDIDEKGFPDSSATSDREQALSKEKSRKATSMGVGRAMRRTKVR